MNEIISDHDCLQIDFDKMLLDTYGCGIYQILLVISLSMGTMFSSMEWNSMIFTDNQPDFECIHNQTARNITWITESSYNEFLINKTHNPEISNLQCYGWDRSTDPFICQNWNYVIDENSNMRRSFITDFDLICQRKSFITYLNITFTLAFATGHLLIGILERFGKRKMFLIVSIGVFMSQLGMGLVSSLWALFLMKALRGLFDTTYLGVCLMCELTPNRRRVLFVNLLWISYGFGYMFTSLLAYLTRDWQNLRLCMLLPFIIMPLTVFVLVEPPRWLCLKGDYQQAMKNCQKIAKINQTKLPDVYARIFKECNSFGALIPKSEVKKISAKYENLFDVKKSLTMTERLGILLIVQTSIVISYTVSTIDDKFASNNMFLSTCYQGLIELPSVVLAWKLSNHLGRRTSVTVLLLIACLMLTFVDFLYKVNCHVYSVIACIGKLGLTTAYGVMDVYATEILPTSIRGSGLFMVVTISLYLNSLAPVINSYKTYSKPVISCLCFVGAFLTFFRLPETRNLDLAETIAEAESLKRGKESEWSRYTKPYNSDQEIIPIELSTI